MTTDDPEWDAAAVDRFNATYDAGMARLDDATLIADLRAHLDGRDVCLVMPRDTDQHTVDLMARISREVEGVIVIGEHAPSLTRAIDHKETHMFRTSALPALLAAASLSAGVPPMPGERDLFRVPTKAPKPPPEVQAVIKAAAEDRRERKRIRNLVSVGHAYGCANVIVLCGSACTCGAKKGASNE